MSNPTIITIDVPLNSGVVVDNEVRTGDVQLFKIGNGILVLDKPNDHAYGTIVSQGTVVVKHASALGNSLSVGPGAQVIIDIGSFNWNNSNNYVSLSNLFLSGNGLIDLQYSQLRVDDGGYDIESIRASLISGRNNGKWNGSSGIISRAANINSSKYGVGYRITTDTNKLIIGFAAYGDVNLDGSINSTDISLINNAGKFAQGINSGSSWSDGDFNYSGTVSITDISMINNTNLFGAGNYLTPQPTPTISLTPSVTVTRTSTPVPSVTPTYSGPTPTPTL